MLYSRLSNLNNLEETRQYKRHKTDYAKLSAISEAENHTEIYNLRGYLIKKILQFECSRYLLH